MMVVPERASHWDYFHLLGSFEDKHKFNYAVKLYLLFVDDGADEGTREYILSRVVGALGAISNSMRAGAFSLFCTLLVNCPQHCDYESVKKVVDNQLKPTGTMKADAEAYVGQFLAYKAIVQSKLLDKTPSLYKEVAEGIMELALKKSYLYPGSLALLRQMSVITGQEYGSDAFLKNLKDLTNATLDKLQYLLQLELKIEDPETSVHVFDGRKLLSTETATEIGILLSKCHNASHEFLKQFFEAISDNHKYLSKFWKSYEKQVKDKIGTNKSILDMYYNLLSQALQQMLAKKNYKSIKTIVSDVAIESLIKHNKLKPELTKQACKSISDILTLANDSALSLEILNKLVSSSFSFDEDSGTKLVGSVWRTLATDEIKVFGDKCLNAAIKGDGIKNKDRLNALNIYCGLLNQPACLLEDQWRIEGMKELLKAGLLSKENVSAEYANAIRKCFYNILSIKFSSLPNYAEALKELVECMNVCTAKKSSSLRVKVTEEMKESWAISRKMITSLEKHKKRSREDNKIIIQALELLTCFITLKSLIEPKESKFNLTDMNSVLSRVTKSDDGSDDGPEWIEVVMDLFLNMLSKPNVGNRNIINIVFKTVTPHLNEGAFSQLIDVLDPSYDLNKAEEEAGEDDGEDNSGDEETNDNTEESEESTDEDDDDSSEESEGDDSDNMDEDEETNSRAFNQEKLQFDLRNALTPANDSDNESINIDDLDEEQGKQLDAKLSAIFKNAMTKKKPSKRESITSHFRTRVVDLLETYCISGMPLEHWLVLIPAVLKLANSIVAAKNTGGLKQRLLSFIRKVSSVKISNISSEDCDINGLVELLQQLINQASEASGTELDLKTHYLELIKFGVKNSTHVHPSNTTELKELMSTVMNTAIGNFFSEKNSLQLELIIFLCQYNWCGVHDMISQIIPLTFAPETKPFKRFQGITMLVGYFKSDRIFLTLEDSNVVKENQKSILLGITTLKSAGLFDQKSQHSAAELIVAMHDSKSSNLAKWKSWKEKLPQLMVVPKDKKFHKHFDAMCKRLGLDKNRFVCDDTETAAASPGKKGKQEPNKILENHRKRKRDVRKLKKESKIRRLAAMDGVDFAWSNMAADE